MTVLYGLDCVPSPFDVADASKYTSPAPKISSSSLIVKVSFATSTSFPTTLSVELSLAKLTGIAMINKNNRINKYFFLLINISPQVRTLIIFETDII